jgi:uncharacterized protein (DUF427 family)
MTQAYWNGQLIAESDACIAVEGTAYFPPDALKREFFKDATHTSVCSWKGTAHYFDVVVNGQTNANAAWIYRDPKDAAKPIAGYVAFWKGVEVKGADAAKPMGKPDGAVC